jgi:flagellar hook-length control protein FliK
MMTVTTPSVINTLTPMTEGVVNSATTGGVAVPNADFTNALNAQLTATTVAPANLTAAPILDESTLLAAQTALFAVTTNAQSPESAVNQTVATTNLTTQQPAALTESAPLATQTLLTTQSISLPNTQTPELAMTSEDREILSNVTDTLKFIATGAKLGDTLPEGQVIRLQNTNTSTPLTQQTVQAAVQQSVNATPVNTPAAVLAQQAMSLQTGEILPNPQTQIQSTEVLAETVLLEIQNKITTEKPVVTTTPAQTVQVEKIVATTTTPVQTVQAEKTVVSATPAQTQTVQAENPVVNTTLAQAQIVQTEKTIATPTTPAQAQIVQTEKTIATPTTPAQAQTVQTEKPIVSATPIQVQTVQTEKPVVSETPPQAQTVQAEKTVATTTAQTVQSEEVSAQAQTVQTEKPVVSATPIQAQTVQTEKPVVSATPIQAQTVQAEKTVVSATPAQTQTVQTEKSVSEIPFQHLQNESEKNALKTNEPVKKEDLPLQNEESLLTQTLPTLVQNDVTQNKSTTAVETVDDSLTKNTESQENSSREAENSEPKPLVTTQAVPVQIETETVKFDAPAEEKPALTPAKNLLADVLANRNNGGDMANNSGDKKGSDTPANSAALPTDSVVKNALDNKQSLDTKSFASLLSAEKSETASASATSTTTNDKVAPQVATAAVNKLAQDMKADVPALTRPLSHPNWNQEVGERIIWMNNRGISSAEIRMNPQNMGPITVRIDVDAEQQTSVSFTAQNADVRTALEASIPRLREMLSSQNLNLADVSVSQQSSTSADSNGSQRQNAQMAADASANGQGNRQSNQEVDANGNPVRQVGANGEEIAVDELANTQVIEGNGTNGLLSLFA